MKMHTAVVIVLCVAMPTVVYPWAGDITSPTISPGKGATQESITAVLDFLTRKCDFKQGGFVNANSWMDYSGSTDALPKLLRLLKAARIEVAVVSSRFGRQDVTFRIVQVGWSPHKRTRVVINLDYPHPDLKGLGKQLGVNLESTAVISIRRTIQIKRTAEQKTGNDK
jgi:hypothetical protein